MTLWRADVHKMLPGRIFLNNKGILEECDKLRVVNILSQTQNWNCTQEEAVERIKQSSEAEPFHIGDEEFWYEDIL